MKTLHSSLSLCLTAALVLGLSGCGSGSSGSSAAPPSDLSAVAGDQSITVNWTATPGVQYWLLIGPAGTTFANASTTPCALFQVNATPPVTYSTLGCSNTYIPVNGGTYDISVNARTNGGPGGTSVSVRNLAVRNGATTWTSLTSSGTSRNFTAAAFGAPMNSSGVISGVEPVFAFVDSASHAVTATLTPTTGGTIQTAVTNTATLPATANAIAYDGTYGFLAGSSTAAQTSYSLDGVTWTAQSSAPANIQGVASRGGGYLTTGSDCTVNYVTGSLANATLATATTWTAETGTGLLSSCSLTSSKTLTVSTTTYDMVAGTQSSKPYIAYTTTLNGASTAWTTAYNTGSGSINAVNAGYIASGVPLWMAVGTTGSAGLGLYSTTGTTWTSVTSWTSGACAAGVVCMPTTNPLTAIAFKSDAWGYLTQAILSDNAGNVYTGVFTTTQGSGPGTAFVLTWTRTLTGTQPINAFAVGTFGYVAVGQAASNPTTTPGVIYTSY